MAGPWGNQGLFWLIKENFPSPVVPYSSFSICIPLKGCVPLASLSPSFHSPPLTWGLPWVTLLLWDQGRIERQNSIIPLSVIKPVPVWCQNPSVHHSTKWAMNMAFAAGIGQELRAEMISKHLLEGGSVGKGADYLGHYPVPFLGKSSKKLCEVVQYFVPCNMHMVSRNKGNSQWIPLQVYLSCQKRSGDGLGEASVTTGCATVGHKLSSSKLADLSKLLSELEEQGRRLWHCCYHLILQSCTHLYFVVRLELR